MTLAWWGQELRLLDSSSKLFPCWEDLAPIGRHLSHICEQWQSPHAGEPELEAPKSWTFPPALHIHLHTRNILHIVIKDFIKVQKWALKIKYLFNQ